MRWFWVVLLASCSPAAGPRITGEMWTDIRPIRERTAAHPFLKGLADGTLPRSRFQFYLIQDSHYLTAFARALGVLAAKAPRDDWAVTLHEHAADALRTERQLHESVLGGFGLTPRAVAETAVAPTNYAYTNHLLATAWGGSFAEGLAAVLPCYWIYWEMGKQLKKAGSPNPEYRRWIDQYSGEEYGKAVEQVLGMMDAEAERMDAKARAAAKALFRTSARYEWMFWDMAWREEKWQP